MTRQEILLDGGEARLILYLHDAGTEMRTNHAVRPCVLICPGGGYAFCSEREQDPPALAFLAEGYQVGILVYSVKEQAARLRPLRQAALAMMELRENSGRWAIDPNRIAILGFSAGGHLAASLSTLWNNPRVRALVGTPEPPTVLRPDAMILCYPVITTGHFSHQGSVRNVCGDDASLQELLSIEKQVDEATPPAFIWHTMDDASVPVENSLMLVLALRAKGISAEYHLYSHGKHGLSMCNEEVGTVDERCASWFGLCLVWLNDLFGFRP